MFSCRGLKTQPRLEDGLEAADELDAAFQLWDFTDFARESMKEVMKLKGAHVTNHEPDLEEADGENAVRYAVRRALEEVANMVEAVEAGVLGNEERIHAVWGIIRKVGKILAPYLPQRVVSGGPAVVDECTFLLSCYTVYRIILWTFHMF